MSISPISKRLRQIRKEAKLSQKQLGILAGIDEFVASARMNQYEKDKHVPSFRTLINIAEVLNVPIPYFYASDDTLALMIKLFGRLSKTKKNEILKILKSST